MTLDEITTAPAGEEIVVETAAPEVTEAPVEVAAPAEAGVPPTEVPAEEEAPKA